MSSTQTVPDPRLRFWYAYKTFIIERTCDSEHRQLDTIEGWRHRLFTNFITFVLPTCFIALVPGVYMALSNGYILVGVSDMLSVVLIALSALNPWMKIRQKKIAVISILYLLAVILLVSLSLLGPGIVYLLSLSVVITITCNSRLAYQTVILNFLICVGCAAIIHFRLLDCNLVKDYTLAVWITVSSNLIFLNFVIVKLVSQSIRILEKIIAKELLLREELFHRSVSQIQMNKLLLESEEHYKSLFYQNPSPMWVLDKKTLRFLQVNQAAIRNYGYTHEEFLSMDVMGIKTDEDKEAVHQRMDENEIWGDTSTLVTRHKRKNGEVFSVEVMFNSIPFMGMEAKLAISKDISLQMNYIRSINEQNEKLREIAWIQSHKVRAPLAVLMGLVQLYKDSLPETPPEELIQGILDSAHQLDTVIKETVLASN
ncbi:MAG: PAS domain S-box protein [Chitinophagaceae bacterium]|jgi:PAS domain S-box-containing protein